MRTLAIAFMCLATSGCAYYLTPRPPLIERKLGSPGNESVGALATAADYRMVYVRIKADGKVCAEPAPDAAGQFAAMFAASLSGPMKDKTLSADTQASLALSMKQLFQRSQGVQFYRDGIFALCNLYLNDGISKEQYFSELQSLRISAKSLIESEIPHLQKIAFDPIASPTLQNTEKIKQEKNETTDTTQK